MDIASLLDDLQPEWKEFIPGQRIYKEFCKLQGKPYVLEVHLNDASKMLGCFPTEELARTELERIRQNPAIVILRAFVSYTV
jgi:hypothetical protein